LTKDGNRAADSVIASNLAWNWNKVSVDSYDFTVGSLYGYVDDYLFNMISPDIYVNNAEGFFTNTKLDATTGDTVTWTDTTAVYDWYNNTYIPTATANKASGLDIKNISAAWLDGTRVKENNFHGVIFGGKAAVSKDKAKQLDETVDDSIRKVKDSVASYDGETIVTINGKTYHTLSWLNTQAKNWMSVIGVDKVGLSKGDVIAIPYGGYRYLYQPTGYDVDTITYSTSTAAPTLQLVTIDLAEFDSMAGWTSVATNEYSGYGLTGFGKLYILTAYDDNGVELNQYSCYVQSV
jgi:hypothetical protein